MSQRLFEKIPSVGELLEMPALKQLVERVSHHAVVNETRSFLDELRREILAKAEGFQVPTPGELSETIARWISRAEEPKLRPVINATGTLLHTGLGRAPLSAGAIESMRMIAADYASLEVDLDSGERGERTAAVERLFREVTGAESALVVNNCAAATVLGLSTVAAGREVIVSRGELIEIGGSYRLPEIMSAGQVVLKEIGTTNRTGLGDYERACHEGTGALLKVHTSNYRVVGFVADVPLEALVGLGRKKGIPVIHDLGSGALFDLGRYGIADEPVVSASISAGADLVLFSGDKLLGGPQCGILLGKASWIERIRKHPLARAFRVDKLRLAALHATLLSSRKIEDAERDLPLYALLATSAENLKHRAERLAPRVVACSAVTAAEVVPMEATLGGGTTPDRTIPSWGIVVTPAGRSVEQFASALRTGNPAVFVRVQQDRVWLDLRTVFPRQETALLDAIGAIGPRSEPPSGEAG